MTSRIIKKILEDENGGMISEAALLFPILIGLGLGGIDMSYMLIQNHKLESQLSAAAGFLSKSDAPEAIEILAKQLAVTGQIDGQGSAVIKGWTLSDVQIAYITTPNNGDIYRSDGDVRTVELSSRIDYRGFGILSSVLPNQARLSGRVQERLIGGGL